LTVLPGKKYLPEDILRIAWRRKWLIVVPFVVVTTVTAIVSSRLPDVFRSSALISVVPQKVPESYVKATVTQRAEDRLQALYQKVQSRTNLERVILEFDLYPRDRRTGIMEDVVDRMRRDIVIESVKGDTFRVSYQSDNRQLAMKVTERLAAKIVDDSKLDRTALSQQTSDFLTAQVEEAGRRLQETERKLAVYKKAHMGELPTEREANLQVLANTNMQLQALNQALNQDRDRRFQLEKAIADLSEPRQAAANVTVSGDDPTAVAGGTVAAQLEAARAQLRLLELKYKPDHPDVRRMKGYIKDLESKAQAEALQRPVSAGGEQVPTTPEEAQRLARLKEARAQLEMLDRQIATKQADEKGLRTAIAVYQARVEATPGRESEMAGLLRDYETDNQTYQSLLRKVEESKLAANMERGAIGELFEYLDAARIPEKPVSPNRPLINLLGALAGLAVGFGFVALLEYRDDSFRTDDEVVSLLSLPVVAVIPLMLNRSERDQLRRRAVLIASATAVIAIAAVAAVGWYLLRYGF
jgi:polysaccharide chain length determinant protein (PEP-CTERM system associated)